MKKPDATLYLEKQGLMFSVRDGALLIEDLDRGAFVLEVDETFQLTEFLNDDACRRMRSIGG